MLVWIRYAPTAPGTRDIDLPDTVRHRSVIGSTLILVPGSTQEVTGEEWSHIKSAHPDLVQHIEVLRG